MASITIRNLNPAVKARLRIQAAKHGHSMEEEARDLLEKGLQPASPATARDLYASIRAKVEAIGGVDDFEVPPREMGPDPVEFEP